MYLIGWLLGDLNDRRASEAAATYGIEALPLSAFRIGPDNSQDSQGLLLGYTAFRDDEIRAGVKRLAEALRSITKTICSSNSLEWAEITTYTAPNPRPAELQYAL